MRSCLRPSKSMGNAPAYGTIGRMGKYTPLRQFLERQPPEVEVSLTVDQIADMTGGLPPAAMGRTWWANSKSSTHVQARSWMDTGRRVIKVRMGELVVFSPATTSALQEETVSASRRSNGPRVVDSILDGVAALNEVLKRAGYDSILQAMAAHTVFLDPQTVSQTNGKAMFPVVRDPNRRGVIDLTNGVMYDDNNSPTLTFLWAAQKIKGRDVQFNHVWADAKNRDTYTALWNLCVTPAFLAKTTDGSNHPEVIDALKCRSFELFGNVPNGLSTPKPPPGYDALKWQDSPPPVNDLEAVFRDRLGRTPKGGPAKSARELGWLFSGGVPDQSI